MGHGLGRDGWPSADTVIKGRDAQITSLRQQVATLTKQRDELKCLLEEAEYYVSSPTLIVEIEEALAAIKSSKSEVTG